MSGSKIHSVQVTGHNENGNDEHHQQSSRQNGEARRENDPRPCLPRSASRAGTAHDSPNGPENLDAEELGLPGLNVHAPWPGLHAACEGCGAPSVSGLGSGLQTCEHCHRRVMSLAAGGKRRSGKGGVWAEAGKEVAVTSSREIALGKEHKSVLWWTGAGMLGTSWLLFLLLLIAW